MMNCQSDDWASSSSRAACASTGRAAGRLERDRQPRPRTVSSSGQSRSQVQAVCSPEPHAEVAVGAPGAGGHPRSAGARRCSAQVARGGDGPHLALLARECAVDLAEEVGALEPPVAEELGVERRDDDALATLALAGRRCRRAGARSGPRAPARARRRLRPGRRAACRPDPRCGAGHPPELESAGPAHLVELEVRAVARVALEPAPDLHGRARVPHVRRRRRPSAVAPPGRPGRASAAAQSVGRVPGRLDDGSALAGSPRGRAGGPAAARWASTKKKRNPASARCSSMPRRIPQRGARGPGLPWTARAVGAFGQPAALRGRARTAGGARRAHRELEADALVAREQRQEAVRGGRADDLEPARRLEGAERRDRCRRRRRGTARRSRISRSRQ